MTEVALLHARRGLFTRREAAFWVGNDGARVDALLKRAVGAGEVLRLRRGLFALAEPYRRVRLHPFELAQRLHGPSYVSLEGALSHHGWIPEAVYAVTSVTSERSRSFATPIGMFSFTRVPQQLFYAAVRRTELEPDAFCLLASPLKALADYVYVHRCDWTAADPVLHSLRVEEEELSALTAQSFDELQQAYASKRVVRFLNGLRKDLRL